MAQLLEAVRDYGPRVELGPTAQLDELAEWMVVRTGLNKSQALMVLHEVGAAILQFNGRGIPVKLPGVGTFTPSVDREGTFKINFRAGVDLKRQIKAEGGYTGRVLNEQRVGLDDEGYRALWDADHPEDPLEL
jgi:hypothetical protein